MNNVTVQESPIDGNSTSCCHMYLSHDDEFLCEGTGFFYKSDNQLYLVSNWHVLSNLSFQTRKKLNKNDKIPNSVLLQARESKGDQSSPVDVTIPLDNWLELPGQCDIGCVPVEGNFRPLNQTSFEAMELQVSDELFVLGYPGGWNATVANSPFWRKASCASDPGIGIRISDWPPNLDAFYIDSSADSGMSGAPVLLLRYEMRINEKGQYTFSRRRDFVGVFSATINKEDPTVRDLGIVWKKRMIDRVIENGSRFESRKHTK